MPQPKSKLPRARAWSRTLVLTLSTAVMGAACQSEPPKPPTPPAAATPPPAAAPERAAAAAAPAPSDGAAPDAKKTKLGPAPTDGLSLAERIERRKAQEAKVAAQLATEERNRLIAYDKTKLKLHTEVFGSIMKVWAAFDAAKSKADVDKVQKKLGKQIVATGKKLQQIDPKGGNSNVVTDYDVMLNALATDYPQAVAASFDGDKAGLAAQRAELDKRKTKIEDWLKLLKSSK